MNRQHFSVLLVSFTLALSLASSALAQEPARSRRRAEPSATSEARPVELLCLDTLEVGTLRDVARAIVVRDAEVHAEHTTNCFVVVGAPDVTRLRTTLTRLEERARARRARSNR